MGEEEYVYFDNIQLDISEKILQSDNVEKALLNYIEKDAYKNADIVIKMCEKNSLLNKYKSIFEQSVQTYKNEMYELAIVGFTSILDGLLADVSGNIKDSIQKRTRLIMDKLNLQIDLENKEYAFTTLGITFEKTMLIFAQCAPFDKEEPEKLNRHWIMHGRSASRRTRLDCIKVIRMIYGLLILNEMCKEE